MHAFSYSLIAICFKIVIILCVKVLVQADDSNIYLKTDSDIYGGCSIPITQPDPNSSHSSRGRKGITGQKGDPGLYVQGPIGVQGYNTTSCKFVEKKSVSKGTGKVMDKPYPSTCESLFSDKPKRESGNVWVGSKEYPFEVFCNKTTKETCINLKYPLDFKKYKKEPFWLSEVGINLRKIDTTTLQIKWIQKRTNTARQIIKYHCKESIPVSKTNHSRSIQLLSWNDKLIGPITTSTSTVNYTVINDSCSTKPEGTSEIVIITSSIRLPIIDVRINDIRSETQEVAIENTLLCYL